MGAIVAFYVLIVGCCICSVLRILFATVMYYIGLWVIPNVFSIIPLIFPWLTVQVDLGLIGFGLVVGLTAELHRSRPLSTIGWVCAILGLMGLFSGLSDWSTIS